MKLAWLSLLLILGAGREPVWAHDWYPASCCSDRDCAPIKPSSVKEASGGYIVTIAPGSHPMWGFENSAPLTVTFAYRDAKPSPDGQWHLCLSPAGAPLCLFAIIGGT